MDIVSCRLEAIKTISRPQILPLSVINARNNACTIGRANFHFGQDTIISRQHARFHITPTEHLHVCNLSSVNGILVNYFPVPYEQSALLNDGDEIVRRWFGSSVNRSAFRGPMGLLPGLIRGKSHLRQRNIAIESG
jgi:FHA domain